VPIIQSISAGLTDLAREYRARGEADGGIVIGDWSFQVGTDGYEVLNPDVALDADFGLQALSAPVGGTRYLGRVGTSGAAAAITPTGSDGLVAVSGLAAIPSSINKRWLRIYGSGDPNANGTWVISSWTSATDVVIHNPLLTAADAGPLNWELREACVLNPNPRAIDFHGRLESPDGTVDDMELGEVGVFCRVLNAPSSTPGLLGNTLLFARANHPAFAKMAEMTVGYHICVQA